MRYSGSDRGCPRNRSGLYRLVAVPLVVPFALGAAMAYAIYFPLWLLCRLFEAAGYGRTGGSNKR